MKTTTAKFSSVFSSRNQYFFETLHVKLISTLLFHKIIILFQIFYIHFKLSSSPFLQWAKSSKTIPFSNNSAKESTVKFTRQFTWKQNNKSRSRLLMRRSSSKSPNYNNAQWTRSTFCQPSKPVPISSGTLTCWRLSTIFTLSMNSAMEEHLINSCRSKAPSQKIKASSFSVRWSRPLRFSPKITSCTET